MFYKYGQNSNTDSKLVQNCLINTGSPVYVSIML